MTQTIKKYTKTLSHVTSIAIKTGDINTLFLEVVSGFIEKEFTEISRENAPRCFPQKETEEKILKEWETVDTYPLRQVNVQELMELRLSKVPGIVYKKGNQFFYSVIPGELNISCKANTLGKHSCAEQCTMVCKGCPRTSALTVAYQQRIGNHFQTAVKKSWRIEKYDFVLQGLETFNMYGQNDAFIVLQCENYQVRSIKTQLSHENVGALKAGLASYAWEDFGGNRAEMLLRLKVNGLRGNTY